MALLGGNQAFHAMKRRSPQIVNANRILCTFLFLQCGSESSFFIKRHCPSGKYRSRGIPACSLLQSERMVHQSRDYQTPLPPPCLRLRGGMGLVPNTAPDYLDKYDGNPENCRCLIACVCPHCMKRTRQDVVLKEDGIPVFDTWQPSPLDVLLKDDAIAIPPGLLTINVPDDVPNMTAAVFGPDYIDPCNRSVVVRAGTYCWEENEDEPFVGHWFKINGRRLHVEGEWEPMGESNRKQLRTFMSGGWFLTYGSVGSINRVVLQKEWGGPLIICMNGNWSFEECRFRVRPGPHQPGHYPFAARWGGGNVIYADRTAELRVVRCFVGFMVHRVKIAMYQGICGEATSRVLIEETMLDGFVHAVMFGENATGVVRRCTLTNNRVGVAINGSAHVTVEKCTIGPNLLGGFCSNVGSESAVLKVTGCKIYGDFWYNVPRPGTIIGWAPRRKKPKKEPRWSKVITEFTQPNVEIVAGGTGPSNDLDQQIAAHETGYDASMYCPTLGYGDDMKDEDAPYLVRDTFAAT